MSREAVEMYMGASGIFTTRGNVAVEIPAVEITICYSSPIVF